MRRPATAPTGHLRDWDPGPCVIPEPDHASLSGNNNLDRGDGQQGPVLLEDDAHAGDADVHAPIVLRRRCAWCAPKHELDGLGPILAGQVVSDGLCPAAAERAAAEFRAYQDARLRAWLERHGADPSAPPGREE